MVFSVHGIVPPSCCMYFLGLRPRKYIQPSHITNPIQGKNYDTTITCMFFTLYHCQYSIMYMRHFPFPLLYIIVRSCSTCTGISLRNSLVSNSFLTQFNSTNSSQSLSETFPNSHFTTHFLVAVGSRMCRYVGYTYIYIFYHA